MAEVFEVRRIRLQETGAPPLSRADAAARDRVWQEKVTANPSLFDGPVAACAGVRWEGEGSLVLDWARVTYRHYALRRAGVTAWLPSLYVSVVQPVEGGLLVARMSASTAAPGRWQLPGGSVEPPGGDQVLDEAALRREAVCELAEEIGLHVPPARLTLWAMARGKHGNTGVMFRAPEQSWRTLQTCYAALVAADRARGCEPELDRIARVRSAGDLAGLDGPHVDYLEPIVRRYAAEASPPP